MSGITPKEFHTSLLLGNIKSSNMQTKHLNVGARTLKGEIKDLINLIDLSHIFEIRQKPGNRTIL